MFGRIISAQPSDQHERQSSQDLSYLERLKIVYS